MGAIRYINVAKHFSAILAKYASTLGQKEIAEIFSTSQPTISRIKKGEMLPSDAMIEKMRSLWNVDLSEEVERARIEGSRVNLRGPRYEKFNGESSPFGVPYYNVDFVGGFDSMFNDQTVVPEGFVNIDRYRKATCLCNITGHSMEPEICHGDIIVLRKIEDWRFLPYGEIYAFVTRNDMRTVKRLGPSSDPETYMLIPANKSPEYAPQELRKEDILRVYEVMGCMKRF